MAGMGDAEGRPAVAVRPRAQRRGAAPGSALTSLASSFVAAIVGALEHRRLFVVVPVAVIVGLCLATLTAAPPQLPVLAGVGVVVLILIPILWRALALLRLVVLFASFWAGFSLLSIHGAFVGSEMLYRPAYGTYTAMVDEVLSDTSGRARLVVSAIAPAGNARVLPIRRARLSIDDAPSIAVGDTISGPIRLYPVPGPVVPGGFDGQFHAHFAGIGAYASATGPVEVMPAAASPAAAVVDGVRRTIGERIDAGLEGPAAGIARALVIGDQSGISEETRAVIANAGLAHVLAISGLHLTLVAGTVFAALRLLIALSETLARRIPAKPAAAVVAIVVALGYFAISGGSVAAQRATIMIVLVFGAVIFGRRALTMRNVALAALIVLALDPASVFRPSFQLSFAAVVALIGAWELRPQRREGVRSFVGQVAAYFLALAATSIVAGVATLLFTIYHFQQTAPLGVVGNLLALPLVGTVMMPSAGLAVLAMPLGLEAPFLMVMGWSIEAMLWLAATVAAWSTPIDHSPLLTPLAPFIGLIALGWFAFFRDRWRYLGPALAVLAVLLFTLDRPPDVLVADTTQAIAARGPDGLALVNGRPGSFAVRVWEETYGEPIHAAADGVAQCDSLGCIVRGAPGFTLAVVTARDAFSEDCDVADVVVARVPIPADCGAAAVIGPDDLARRGVHWLRWDVTRGEFEIRPAIRDPGKPWRPPLR